MPRTVLDCGDEVKKKKDIVFVLRGYSLVEEADLNNFMCDKS